jgi:hypothetical protein
MSTKNASSVAFTPAVACIVSVTVRCDADAVGGSDFGMGAGGGQLCTYLTQSGTTTFGDNQGLTSVRAAYVSLGVFTAAAGAACEAGLFINNLGSGPVHCWNIDTVVELIKR